jgi:hypothetical protein
MTSGVGDEPIGIGSLDHLLTGRVNGRHGHIVAE